YMQHHIVYCDAGDWNRQLVEGTVRLGHAASSYEGRCADCRRVARAAHVMQLGPVGVERRCHKSPQIVARPLSFPTAANLPQAAHQRHKKLQAYRPPFSPIKRFATRSHGAWTLK